MDHTFKIHLNIGSNMGDREANLRRAVALIASAWPDARLHTAGPVESPPWGYKSPNPFLNIGLLLELPRPVSPLSVLDTTQAIERTAGRGTPHRNPDGTYRDRIVDIDIIDIDGLAIDTPRLTLPHPRAALRPFVLGPLRALDPATADRILDNSRRPASAYSATHTAINSDKTR